MWAFNRRLDASKIERGKIIWNGPLSWICTEKIYGLPEILEI